MTFLRPTTCPGSVVFPHFGRASLDPGFTRSSPSCAARRGRSSRPPGRREPQHLLLRTVTVTQPEAPDVGGPFDRGMGAQGFLISGFAFTVRRSGPPLAGDDKDLAADLGRELAPGMLGHRVRFAPTVAEQRVRAAHRAGK